MWIIENDGCEEEDDDDDDMVMVAWRVDRVVGRLLDGGNMQGIQNDVQLHFELYRISNKIWRIILIIYVIRMFYFIIHKIWILELKTSFAAISICKELFLNHSYSGRFSRGHSRCLT